MAIPSVPSHCIAIVHNLDVVQLEGNTKGVGRCGRKQEKSKSLRGERMRGQKKTRREMITVSVSSGFKWTTGRERDHVSQRLRTHKSVLCCTQVSLLVSLPGQHVHRNY